MSELNLYVTVAASGLAGLGMVVAAGLSGWREWVALKRRELDARVGSDVGRSAGAGAGARIELADLRERIRKLEAIAAGVDL